MQKELLAVIPQNPQKFNEGQVNAIYQIAQSITTQPPVQLPDELIQYSPHSEYS